MSSFFFFFFFFFLRNSFFHFDRSYANYSLQSTTNNPDLSFGKEDVADLCEGNSSFGRLHHVASFSFGANKNGDNEVFIFFFVCLCLCVCVSVSLSVSLSLPCFD